MASRLSFFFCGKIDSQQQKSRILRRFFPSQSRFSGIGPPLFLLSAAKPHYQSVWITLRRFKLRTKNNHTSFKLTLALTQTFCGFALIPLRAFPAIVSPGLIRHK